MLKIGCHLSISKGYLNAAKEASSIGANTFQYFTRNPRGGKAKDLDTKDVNEFNKFFNEHNFAPLFAHAPYTMNLASDKEDIREFAKNVFAEDLIRLSNLPKSYYVFHPGSHVGQGVDIGIKYISDALNNIIKKNNQIDILLEGMSGKGSEIGSKFEQIKKIIDNIEYNEKVGVCLDTCHLHSSGYDIVNSLDGVLDEFDRIIGINRLKAFHLNDNKNEFSSQKDRHEKVGDGSIGLEGIVKIINNDRLKNLVFNLETPNEIDGYKLEIELLKKNYKG